MHQMKAFRRSIHLILHQCASICSECITFISSKQGTMEEVFLTVHSPVCGSSWFCQWSIRWEILDPLTWFTEGQEVDMQRFWQLISLASIIYSKGQWLISLGVLFGWERHMWLSLLTWLEYLHKGTCMHTYTWAQSVGLSQWDTTSLPLHVCKKRHSYFNSVSHEWQLLHSELAFQL